MNVALATAIAMAALVVVAPASADETEVCATAAEHAQPKRRAGDFTGARPDLVTCARPVCPAVIRTDCQKWLTDVDKVIGSLIIRAVDEKGHDLVEVEVTIDDKPLTTKLDGHPIAVNPGAHTLKYSAAGRTTLTEQIVVRETEQNRLVNVTLAPTETKPATPPPQPDVPQRPKQSLNPLVYVFGGVSIAAIGTGVALWAVGSGERGDLKDTCAPTSTCSDDSIDSARTKLIIGDVLVGVGLLSAAAAVWFALTPAKGSPTAVRVTPVGLRGSF